MKILKILLNIIFACFLGMFDAFRFTGYVSYYHVLGKTYSFYFRMYNDVFNRCDVCDQAVLSDHVFQSRILEFSVLGTFIRLQDYLHVQIK